MDGNQDDNVVSLNSSHLPDGADFEIVVPQDNNEENLTRNSGSGKAFGINISLF